MGATIPVAFGQTRCSHRHRGYEELHESNILSTTHVAYNRSIYTYQVKSATGSNLCHVGNHRV